MKKLTTLLLCTLMTLSIFTSCSSDDDSIVGKWAVASSYPGEVKTNNAKATAAIKESIKDEINEATIIEFFEDGKWVGDGEFGTYTVKDNTLIIYIEEEGETYTIRYDLNVNDNNATLSYDNKEEYDTYFFRDNQIENPESVVVDKAVIVLELLKQ